MKRKMHLLLAIVCLGATSLFYTSCKKDVQKTATPTTVQAVSIGTNGRSASGTEAGAREYTSTDVSVDLTDEGRQGLIESGMTQIKQTGENSYMTVKTQLPGPVQPYDPIICDGMTYSQMWADINQKWNNFRNSPSYQSAKNAANAMCRPVFVCIANCGVAVMYAIQPDRRCITLAECLAVDRIKASLVAEAP